MFIQIIFPICFWFACLDRWADGKVRMKNIYSCTTTSNISTDISEIVVKNDVFFVKIGMFYSYRNTNMTCGQATKCWKYNFHFTWLLVLAKLWANLKTHFYKESTYATFVPFWTIWRRQRLRRRRHFVGGHFYRRWEWTTSTLYKMSSGHCPRPHYFDHMAPTWYSSHSACYCH